MICNPAVHKTKIVYSFGLSESNRVKVKTELSYGNCLCYSNVLGYYGKVKVSHSLIAIGAVKIRDQL